MAGKIKVYGKTQNRTALGIVKAFLILNPDATLERLRQAFPNSVCPDSGVKELFLPVDEAEQHNAKIGLYFTKGEEPLTLADGRQIALAQVWSKTSLDKIVAKATAYDIEVAECDKSRQYGASGYDLEYINGWQPAKPKKGCLGMIILFLMATSAFGVAVASNL